MAAGAQAKVCARQRALPRHGHEARQGRQDQVLDFAEHDGQGESRHRRDRTGHDLWPEGALDSRGRGRGRVHSRGGICVCVPRQEAQVWAESEAGRVQYRRLYGRWWEGR